MSASVCMGADLHIGGTSTYHSHKFYATAAYGRLCQLIRRTYDICIYIMSKLDPCQIIFWIRPCSGKWEIYVHSGCFSHMCFVHITILVYMMCVTSKCHSRTKSVFIFGLCPNILILQRNFKLIILGTFL